MPLVALLAIIAFTAACFTGNGALAFGAIIALLFAAVFNAAFNRY